MIDITGTIVGLKTGIEAQVEKHEGPYVYLSVNGVPKKYDFAKAFLNGGLTAVDPAIQKEIMDLIETIEEPAQNDTPVPEPVKYPSRMFPSDFHVEFLKRNPVLTYEEVEKEFGINLHGFGRGINITDTSIVLISYMKKDADVFVYHDHWTENGEYIYSGEGRQGNQQMKRGNWAIANASFDNRKIYLFIKFSPQEYYFQGEFICINYTQETENDADGLPRKEYKFRLRRVG